MNWLNNVQFGSEAQKKRAYNYWKAIRDLNKKRYSIFALEFRHYSDLFFFPGSFHRYVGGDTHTWRKAT